MVTSAPHTDALPQSAATHSNGTLWLIPVPLALKTDITPTLSECLLPASLQRIAALDYFVVENAKSARAFLKHASPKAIQGLHLSELNEHSHAHELPTLAAPLLAGHDVGLLSEAGCPAVADPGALLVAYAHQHHISVRPLVGPSSLLLALMASGLDGQRFSFHGYLPVSEQERKQAIRTLEKTSAQRHETQLFIETPYRNPALFHALLATCQSSTRLCIASNLTLPQESIITRTIGQWRNKPAPALKNQASVFLLLA